MKVTVINGSPKANRSVTLQSVLYLKKKYPDDEFEIINTSAAIKRLASPAELAPVVDKMSAADLILIIYPVYTFVAPSQLHRLFELIEEGGFADKLKDKYVTQLTTSKHFYDYTAHEYVKQNVLDFGCRYVKGISCDMDDLTKEEGRKELIAFWDYTAFCVESGVYEQRERTQKPPLPAYIPQFGCVEPKKEGFDTVMVTNMTEEETSLKAMIDDFIAVYPYPVRVENINDFAFKGGCIGCINCAIAGECVYKDGFRDYLDNKINNADVVITAATIKQHFIGADFKRYDDRMFCNGHRTVSMGKPTGYIVSGRLSDEPNLHTILEGRAEVGHLFLTGIVSDESATASDDIVKMAKATAYALEHKVVYPQNYMGVGGRLIFRDLVYKMQGLMREDHKFYKNNGFYDDFPQKDKATIMGMRFVGSMLKNKKVRAKIMPQLSKFMLMPYKKVIDDDV